MDNNNLNNQDPFQKQEQDVYQQNTYQQEPYQQNQQNTYQQQPYQQNQQNIYQQEPYQQNQQNTYQQEPYQQNPYQQPYQNAYQQDNGGLEEPVSFGDWMVSLLVMSIPCVNIIMMFVWAFGSGTNKSKSNFFKANLVWTLIWTVLAVIMVIVFSVSIVATLGTEGYPY